MVEALFAIVVDDVIFRQVVYIYFMVAIFSTKYYFSAHCSLIVF